MITNRRTAMGMLASMGTSPEWEIVLSGQFETSQFGQLRSNR